MCKRAMYPVCFVLLLGLANNACAEIPRDPNLVIYYSYDSVGMIVPDESGKGHSGTVCGDVSVHPSGVKWYGAAKFLGEWGPTRYSYLDLDSPHYPTADIPKSAITLAAWVRCEKTGKDHAILSCRAADNTWVIHPQINDNGTYRWLLRANGSVTLFNLNGVGTHGWDEWRHYAGTYDSATGKGTLYIDGVVCASTDVTAGQRVADWGTGARVGYNIDNARPFTGLMDEFYLFTRALSQAEVEALLNSEGLPSEKAAHPSPGNGTELDTTSTVLEWLPGAYAVSNDVYFGESLEDVNNGAGDTFKGNQTEAQFTAADLVWGKTYYWRIDGVNPADPNSPWKGDVWSFLLRPSTAWNPTPSDDARWIDPNADLTWSLGRGAAAHTVYFGDNFDDVNNAAGGSLQAGATYDPGTLDFEKVHFWRVDELDDAGKTHKGSVWSFTTMRSGSGVKGEYYKDTKLETLVLTRTDPGINFNWVASAPDPQVPADSFSVRWTGELEVPFTSSWTFTANCDDCVRLWVNDRLLFDKWGQQSGVEWTGTVDLAVGQKYSVVMEYYENTGDARAILYWNSPYWLSPYQPKQIIPQGAFSLPLRARSPNPSGGAVDVFQTSVLRWSPGEGAVSHHVYFGTDANAVKDADAGSPQYKGSRKLGSESYDPGGLEWNTVYYWRIDEVNEAGGVQKGNLWSFTSADFLVVEDFEAYNDDIDGGTAIYQTWLDGVANGTTSYVGYANSSNGTFGETTIVHSGSQSMPLAYSNGDSPYYAEASRTWDAAQDWTLHGVDTLVLRVRGIVTNGAAPLYAAVEDGAGHLGTVVHSEAAVTTSESWTEWKISLSQFAGVSMTSVKTLYIGLGSRGAKTPGGAGTIYIDDIWVTKGQ